MKCVPMKTSMAMTNDVGSDGKGDEQRVLVSLDAETLRSVLRSSTNDLGFRLRLSSL